MSTTAITAPAPDPVKLIIAGPPGGGASSFVAAVSHMVSGMAGREFGRCAVDVNGAAYLFAVTGAGWWLVWRSMLSGAQAVIIVTPAGRLREAFPALNAAAESGLPHVVLLNTFAETARPRLSEIRDALAVGPVIPILTCNVRDRTSATRALAEVVRYLRTTC